MSASNAFGSDVLLEETSLPVLTLKSYGELEQHYRRRRRDLLKIAYQEAEIPPRQMADEIARMEARGVTPHELADFASTDDGFKIIIGLSLKQVGRQGELDKIMAGIPPLDRPLRAGQVAGFLRLDPDTKAGDANPPVAEPSSTGTTDTSASADTTQAPTPQA
jgi:hypothetical protein